MKKLKHHNIKLTSSQDGKTLNQKTSFHLIIAQTYTSQNLNVDHMLVNEKI
jgi:hypothetical protein